MNSVRLFRSAAASAALAALALCFAAPVSAQQYQQYPAQSAPAAFAGLDCSRCTLGSTYCVINVLRFEYACAPSVGTYACAGISGTSYCRYGTMCWDGVCR